MSLIPKETLLGTRMKIIIELRGKKIKSFGELGLLIETIKHNIRREQSVQRTSER